MKKESEVSDKSLTDKAIDIKGKQYVLVADRVVYFNEQYPNGAIHTEYTEEESRVTFKATVYPDVESEKRYFTGFSQAIWGEGMVNKTSALENAETSAVGRALAMMGIGVIGSIASVDEINKAQNTEKIMEELGNCNSCHAPNAKSKIGNVYCSAKCWLQPGKTAPMTQKDQEWIDNLDSIPTINQED